jgi:hypothetical protein
MKRAVIAVASVALGLFAIAWLFMPRAVRR